MKFLVFVLAILSVISTSQANEVIIQDRELIGGGYELLMVGNPTVTHESKNATVIAGETQMLVFQDDTSRSHHRNGVEVELRKSNLVLKGVEMIESGGVYRFSGEVEIYQYGANKAGGRTTSSCSGGIVHKDGESTGVTEVTHRGVLTISCDRYDNVVVTRNSGN